MNSNSSSRCLGLWKSTKRWTVDGVSPFVFCLSIFAFCLSSFLFSSCGKDEISLQNFRELPAPTTDDLTAVWFTDEKTGYLTGGKIWERGFVMHTSDGGESWQTDTVTSNLLENIQFDRTGQGYACGPDGLVIFKKPNALHWEVARRDWRWYRACFFVNPKLGVAVGGTGWREGKMSRLSPNPWMMDTVFQIPNQLDAVWFSDSTTAHAVGLGWVLRSSDAGRTWQRSQVPSDFYHAVHFPTAEVGYTCAENGSILKTTDAGRSWQTLRDGNSVWVQDRAMRSLWFVSAEKGYIVGADGLFWRTENGGADWEQIKGTPSDADFTDIYRVGTKGWATTKNGRIFLFED